MTNRCKIIGPGGISESNCAYHRLKEVRELPRIVMRVTERKEVQNGRLEIEECVRYDESVESQTSPKLPYDGNISADRDACNKDQKFQISKSIPGRWPSRPGDDCITACSRDGAPTLEVIRMDPWP
jgi:hypothetical protein